MRYLYSLLLTALLLASGAASLRAQDKSGASPTRAVYGEPIGRLWINTYGTVRLTNRVFWVAQTHFRFQETERVPLAGQVAQLYNRHALGYLFSKKFKMSVGGVLRVNFNTAAPSAERPDDRNVVPEWRIWHEYLFAMPMSRLMVYNRVRIEHRWTRGFSEGSEWIFRNRWRYMMTLKIPVNKKTLSTHAFYVAPEAEVIMQSGKSVVDSPFEDLRLHTSFGYILTPRLTLATGLMYSQGQDLADGAFYKQRWTCRLHAYFSPDFRRVKNKLPAIHMTD
ncbi:MAG: DUF2490 domain-containing protein [Catalinimonas sp.]